jgi:plastocyanin
MRRREVIAGLGVVVGTGLAGCGGVLGSGCGVDEYDVGMTASAFDPRELTVEVGDTVRWLNDSQRAHTVTAYDDELPAGADFFASGGYDSTGAARDAWSSNGGAIHTCDVFEHTFGTHGEYPYFCVPHERAGMVGTVVVEE